jgi:hypothetical protein
LLEFDFGPSNSVGVEEEINSPRPPLLLQNQSQGGIQNLRFPLKSGIMESNFVNLNIIWRKLSF